MNKTIVPYTPSTSEQILADLTSELPMMSPELRKVATWLLEHPNEVGISSVREIAAAADVKPNTLVRMARSLGYSGFDEFREPFRNDIRQGRESFPDRARWLQSLSRGGKLSAFYADMAAANLTNIEGLYSDTNHAALKAAARDIVKSRTTYVLGVGFANAMARNFAYLADMSIDNVVAIPREGSVPMDGLVRASRRDVLLAMTFKPYRSEVLHAVDVALEHGLTVIGVSDSPASPILGGAQHRFVVPVETPHFFPSTVATSALLETLMAFIIAEAGPQAVANIERFHLRRRELGLYWNEEG